MPTASIIVTVATLVLFAVFSALVAYGLHQTPKGWNDPQHKA